MTSSRRTHASGWSVSGDHATSGGGGGEGGQGTASSSPPRMKGGRARGVGYRILLASTHGGDGLRGWGGCTPPLHPPRDRTQTPHMEPRRPDEVREEGGLIVGGGVSS
ncbi:hypothetical protein Pmani_019301 [Petrolisthes manimaculis]|uniref:Uncharacterized protein n=1 Tax=Petrolisthes manimaculis TaxID=1843537 RepID=A0AAE1PKZ1_9EUCA|nr:hypothetical protein Pmani_019301 [Petrolisthes manimaculis]